MIDPLDADGLPQRTYPLRNELSKVVDSWKIMSKTSLKKTISSWDHFKKGWVFVQFNVIGLDSNGKPINFRVKKFNPKENMDGFLVELANMADRHGIVKIKDRSIWFREAKDLNELNIDDCTMTLLMNKVHE